MRALIFKYRGLLWGLFAIAIFVFPVHFSGLRAAAAVPLLVGGQLLRFWAAGIIPKYRTLTLDAPELVTWGPYAWVRNPLYAGNALMGCGWSVMAGWAWLPAFVAAYTVLYALVIIPDEEKFLVGRFGDEYRNYRTATPGLIPSPTNFREKTKKSKIGFDRRKSWFMERHSLRMNLLVTAVVLLRLLVLKY